MFYYRDMFPCTISCYTYVHVYVRRYVYSQLYVNVRVKIGFILQGDTTYLIYSFHNEDPVDNEQFSQHQFQESLIINLFGQPESVPPLPDDVQYFDIVNDNVCKDTFIMCS